MAERDDLDRDEDILTEDIRDSGDDLDEDDEAEEGDLDEADEFASGLTDEVGSEGGSPGSNVRRPDDRGPSSGSEATETVRRRR
jgi:hypothetical protein